MMLRSIIGLVVGMFIVCLRVPFFPDPVPLYMVMFWGSFFASYIGRNWFLGPLLPLIMLLFSPSQQISYFREMLAGAVDNRMPIIIMGIVLPLVIALIGGLIGYALARLRKKEARCTND